MTVLPQRLGAPAREHPAHESGQLSVHDLIAGLRDAAGQMVPFSRTKTLLREAASTIERLETDARHHATEVARLTAELARVR